MRKIDNLLLCVGAQKAGTSWLAKMLTRHHSIEFSEYKEIHYFDYLDNLNKQLPKRLIDSMSKVLSIEKKELCKTLFPNEKQAIEELGVLINHNWYCNQFSHELKYCADFTPEYALLSDECWTDIKLTSKKQKVIFIMREPVGRTLSAVQYFYQNRNIDIDAIEPEVLKTRVLTDLFISRSRYENTIKKIKKQFSSEDVLYLFYEDMMLNKQETLDKVTDFLLLEAIVLDQNSLNKKINPSKGYDFSSEVIEILEKELSSTIESVKESIGYVPKEWKR